MLALWDLLGGFRGFVVGCLAIMTTLGAVGIWLPLVHDPRVAAAARAEYVAIALDEAKKAHDAEMERQRLAGAQAIEEYRHRLAAAEAQDAKDEAEQAAKIADMERRLEAAGKSWLLDEETKQFLER